MEKPFLECAAIMELRFHQAIPSKKGRIPPAEGIIAPVTVRRHLLSPIKTSIDAPHHALEHILKAKKGMVILPVGAELPSGPLGSRFLAKAALEAMASGLLAHPDGLEYLVDEAQLDPMRNHARRGDIREWPIHVRCIYDQLTKRINEAGFDVQVVNEFDILTTDKTSGILSSPYLG